MYQLNVVKCSGTKICISKQQYYAYSSKEKKKKWKILASLMKHFLVCNIFGWHHHTNVNMILEYTQLFMILQIGLVNPRL